MGGNGRFFPATDAVSESYAELSPELARALIGEGLYTVLSPVEIFDSRSIDEEVALDMFLILFIIGVRSVTLNESSSSSSTSISSSLLKIPEGK